jgi:amino acid transporter
LAVASKPVFVRDATGLVREISFLGAFALASANMNVITGWFIFESIGPAVPGGEIGIATLIGACLVVFPAMVYAMLIAAFPRAGGDYVFVSRILTPELGFMVNFYLAFYWMSAIGWQASIIVVPSITAVLASYGFIYNNPTLLAWVTALGNINTQTILGLVLLVIYTCLVAFLNVKRIFRVMSALLVFSMLAVFLIIGVTFTSTPSQFASALNAVTGMPNLYQTIINNASHAGMVPTWTMAATFGPALLFSYLILGGWQYPAFVAGEVKQAQRNTPLAIILALGINGLLYVLLYEGIYRGFGYPFMSAVGFSGVSPSTAPMIVPFFVSIMVKDNPVLLFLISFGLLVGGPWLQLSEYVFGTRCIFAWSFDRVVPTKFSQLSERTGAPIYAVFLAGLVYGALFLLLYNYTNLATYYTNMVMGYVIVSLIIMVAAIVFPFRKKEMFQTAPSFTTKKILGFPLVSIMGIIALIYLAYTLYGTLTNPAIGGPIYLPSIEFMVGLLAFAPILYWISVLYHRRQGIDIRLAFKQIPPE